ncbi:MAG: hypothetical protein OXG27_08060, partial [Chloroflexi bacterium]|nr:hypothetical protein [Chloroflexota bacterium]
SSSRARRGDSGRGSSVSKSGSSIDASLVGILEGGAALVRGPPADRQVPVSPLAERPRPHHKLIFE